MSEAVTAAADSWAREVTAVGHAAVSSRTTNVQMNGQNHPVAAKSLRFQETPDRQLGCIFLLFAVRRWNVGI